MWTLLSQAMEALIHMYQLWAGLHHSILVDTQPCPWIPNHWLTHLHNSMHTNQLHINYSFWKIVHLWHNDCYLMENYDQGLPWLKLEELNTCRMYLQDTTFSKITDHIGTELLSQILTCPSHPLPCSLTSISKSLLVWPIINLLTPACWQFWTTTICLLYTGSSKGNWLLHHLLGKWLPSHQLNRFWYWWMYDMTQLVYKPSESPCTHVALPALQWQMFMKFSPTFLMTLAFLGPPVTP